MVGEKSVVVAVVVTDSVETEVVVYVVVIVSVKKLVL